MKKWLELRLQFRDSMRPWPRSFRPGPFSWASAPLRESGARATLAPNVDALERADHRLRHLVGGGASAKIGRQGLAPLGDELDRPHETGRGAPLAEMIEHHGGRPEGAERIGDALADDVEGGAVDRLEHGGTAGGRVG